MALRKLGPYTIHEPLGSGGMGSVYRGVEDGSHREVAVKVLSPALVSDAGFRDRFESEIKSLEQLIHPNIVELYGFGEHDGQLFYAMELVVGSNLQEELSSGRRFTWREVTDFGIQICGALKHAHDRGIIHRDIKPANLIIDRSDRIQLTDFGIAKLFGDTNQTVDGGILGTADYMAPEQAEGLSVVPRSDIYSLGASLYALLAGRAPFQGKSLPEVVHKVRFEPPLPVRRFAPDTPEELEELLDSLLAKDPSDRIPTPLALSKRLAAIRDSRSLDQASANDESIAACDPDVTSLSNEEQLASLETAVIPPDGYQDNPTQHASVAILESEDEVATGSSNRYTAVDSEYRKRLQIGDAPEVGLVEQIAKGIGVTILIASLGGAAWYLSRSPSADELFAKVERANVRGDAASLRDANEMRAFLKAFPDDERCPQVSQWLFDADLRQETRRLDSLSKTAPTSPDISAIEWQMIEAIRNERNSDPDKALRRFKAILEMSPDRDGLDHRDQLCLEIATQRLEQMTETSSSIGWQKQQELISERIETARELVATDRDAALQILNSIVDFYQDDPWASDLVAKAQAVATQVDSAAP